METLLKYFPELSPYQREQFESMVPLYREWNEKINVISRKDIENICVHHILHSLAIAKVIAFLPHTRVLDVGTGGGFPGIPLAIVFPEVNFQLIDSIGKKIKVVKAVAAALGLKNVSAQQERAENMQGTFDFIVSRAVSSLPEFHALVKNKIRASSAHSIPNGILYLKGGQIDEELAQAGGKTKHYPIASMFSEEYFREKFVVHIFTG